jgi:hypothetical protein
LADRELTKDVRERHCQAIADPSPARRDGRQGIASLSIDPDACYKYGRLPAGLRQARGSKRAKGGKRMNWVALIIQIISGAVGGNIVGAAAKNISLGTAGNSVAGVVGGGLGGYILQLLGLLSNSGGMDIGSIISQIAGGGVGGGVLMAIIGAIRQAMNK